MINRQRRIHIKLIFAGMSLFWCMGPIDGQNSIGAEIITKENYLYGRFEVVMQSAESDGIVSSFFLYNIEAGNSCHWPAENNEIDVEMTGNNQQIYFTTHHPAPVQPWYYGENFYAGFNPHDSLHTYIIEWEPGVVRWFVDDQLYYVQNDSVTNDLHYPMAIYMNLWASDAVDWVGVWDPSVMPRQSKYDYVKYYKYTPGNGNIGTNNNFTFEWEDPFTSLDTARWDISDFTQLGNLTTFRESNVDVENGYLMFTLDEPQPNTEFIPVTFSVNMNEYNLLPSDIVFLNGSFNNWCGNCKPMTEHDGIWSATLNLHPEKYEFIFTINVWQTIGYAPLGSACDYKPCDEFANYGVYVPAGSAAIILDTYCWEQCSNCQSTSVTHIPQTKEKKLINIYDLLGRTVEEKKGQILFYLYDDGSVEKKIILNEK